jgi:hypothetical protein
LHDEIPTRDGHWTTNLEGSYPLLEELRTLSGLGARWLYIDRGWREILWSTHCNTGPPRWPPCAGQRRRWTPSGTPSCARCRLDRDRPWDPTERPRPGSVDKTLAFAAYAVDVAASLAPNR